jgi:hypothetical protein
MRAALLLACCLGLGGCFFSLDGNLVNRPRDSGASDRHRDGLDGGAREAAVLAERGLVDLAPVVDLAVDVAVGLDR